MKYQHLLAGIPFLAIALVVGDSPLYGRGRGGGGGYRATTTRSGTATGSYGRSVSGSSTRSRSTVVGPSGSSASRGTKSGSYTTSRGGTVNYAGAGSKYTGPRGSAGRAVGGASVTTASGKSYTKAGAAGGVKTNTGKAAVRGGSVAVGKGPGGTATKVTRGGAAVGPHGGAAYHSKYGAVTGPNGLSRYSARRSTVAVGHHTAFVSHRTLHAHGAYVRTNFAHYHCFNHAWYVAHPGAWRAAAWTSAVIWRATTWAVLASSCGYPSEPAPIDYGSNVVYDEGQVYQDGEPVATEQEYTQQAATIAKKGKKAKVTDKEEWIPLGVFAMVQGDEKDSNNIFQLAINKDGVIRGNYYNALTDSTKTVKGMVDKKTQRAAWTIGTSKDTVYETGIANLSQPETSMLVHFGKDRTQQWTLVRVEKPKDKKKT